MSMAVLWKIKVKAQSFSNSKHFGWWENVGGAQQSQQQSLPWAEEAPLNPKKHQSEKSFLPFA